MPNKDRANAKDGEKMLYKGRLVNHNLYVINCLFVAFVL
jgi:hypothetical protein